MQVVGSFVLGKKASFGPSARRLCSWAASLLIALSSSCASPPEDDGQGGDGDSGDGDSGDGDSGDGDVTPDPAGCKAASDSPAHPFGSHELGYHGGTIFPAGDASELDARTAALYDNW